MTILEQAVTNDPAPKPKRAVKAKQEVAVHQPQAPATNITGNMLILKQAMDNGATGDDLKAMLDLYERLEDRAARKAFDDALANAQAEIPVIVKNRLVDFATAKGGRTSYKHEDLAEIVRTIQPYLHKHGLGHRFRTEQFMRGDKSMIKVTCIITGHGWREETPFESGPDSNSSTMNEIQRMKSAVTYMERITLTAALGLAASHDDDGRGTVIETSANITALQLKELEALIAEVNANAANVCKACHVESLAEMTTAQFEKAKAKLESMKGPL